MRWPRMCNRSTRQWSMSCFWHPGSVTPGCHSIEREADGALLFICVTSGQPAIRFRSSVPGKLSPSAASRYTSEAFKATMNFWRSWIARSHCQGR